MNLGQSVGELATRYQHLQQQLAAMYGHSGVDTEHLNQVANQIHETELALMSAAPPESGMADWVGQQMLPRRAR